MKFNKWTVALAAIGVVSLASAARADEQPMMQMNAVQTALSSTTLSGYVDTAATWRPGTDLNSSSGTANIPAYSFAKNDGFSLNAVDIALDHPEGASPWAAGYHVELMYGPDAVGEGIGSNATLRQAYLSLRTPVGNGIDWKVGVWDTIIGYESSSDPLDPNYTRSYGYTIEPTTHLGVLGTYKVNDMVTVQAGMADDSNVGLGGIGVNPNHFESQKAYMGDLQFTAPESAGWMNGATLTLGVVNTAGNNSPALTAAGTPAYGSTSWYVGMTMPTPNSALKLGAAFDYLELHNSHGASPGVAANPSDDSTWVAGLYSSYQATAKLDLNLRAEYLSSSGNGLYDVQPGIESVVTPYPGNAAEEITVTAQYQLWENVISRLEFRWDHVEHGNFFGYNSADVTSSNPTGANRANDFMLALNLIYQF